MTLNGKPLTDAERIRLMIAIETEDEYDLATQPVLVLSLTCAREADSIGAQENPEMDSYPLAASQSVRSGERAPVLTARQAW